MSDRQRLLRLCMAGCLVLTLVMSTNACAGSLGLGGDSWKEEVLLHDGSKLLITRSQTYGGQHEIGQPPPIKEHTITFTLPGSNKTISWTSEYGKDLGRTNFFLLAVHVLKRTPYIVTEPNLCLSYNKWGRPNPPYVFFKYDGAAWQRIPLEEFPAEFSTVNVALDIMGREVKRLVDLRLVSSETIKDLNSHIDRSEVKTLLREPVKSGAEGSAVNCEEMIHYKCGWINPQGTFGREFMDRTCK
jgi:hypothetical protein